MLRFINTVIQTADGRNAKVFHQQEFINAGFDIKELEQVKITPADTILILLLVV